MEVLDGAEGKSEAEAGAKAKTNVIFNSHDGIEDAILDWILRLAITISVAGDAEGGGVPREAAGDQAISR